jgi:hypothetical protein
MPCSTTNTRHRPRWFTTGLVRALGDLAEIELDDLAFSDVVTLMRGRHQARRALGQPADHLDELFDRYRTERASQRPGSAAITRLARAPEPTAEPRQGGRRLA